MQGVFRTATVFGICNVFISNCDSVWRNEIWCSELLHRVCRDQNSQQSVIVMQAFCSDIHVALSVGCFADCAFQVAVFTSLKSVFPAQQPNAGQGRLTLEDFRSHSYTPAMTVTCETSRYPSFMNVVIQVWKGHYKWNLKTWVYQA